MTGESLDLKENLLKESWGGQAAEGVTPTAQKFLAAFCSHGSGPSISPGTRPLPRRASGPNEAGAGFLSYCPSHLNLRESPGPGRAGFGGRRERGCPSPLPSLSQQARSSKDPQGTLRGTSLGGQKMALDSLKKAC